MSSDKAERPRTTVHFDQVSADEADLLIDMRLSIARAAEIMVLLSKPSPSSDGPSLDLEAMFRKAPTQ